LVQLSEIRRKARARLPREFDAPALPFGVTESFLDLSLRIKGTGRL
jgi:hypothetical protein